ncbi:MAG: hypothetical protein ACREMM_10340 [Gemmatimonadales bacterium]
MPVTAKLSRKFYDTFGDEIANELVNWFNEVDATYRADLRELNDLNFARFDAKLGERLAELDAKWGGRWGALEARLAALGDTLRKELAQSLSELKSSLLKWMFGFWASVVLTLVVLAFRR